MIRRLRWQWINGGICFVYLRFCRWGPGPGGCCWGGGGVAGAGALKKARKPGAGGSICPTRPCSNLGFMAASGLPTNPGTRANWLGDIRPGCSYKRHKISDSVDQQVPLLLSTEKWILLPSVTLSEKVKETIRGGSDWLTAKKGDIS